jgi:hypothetical protein
MDLIGAVKIFEKFMDSTEVVAEQSMQNQDEPVEHVESIVTLSNITTFIVATLIGCYAVYLSWTCNTLSGISTPLKVIYAFFAYIFGMLYLIFYVIFRAGACQLAITTGRKSK